ncbi:MAG: hypothetical protein NC399_05275 [Muribaculum sp.]|nr:hypothetical protein [Muribaculum sp.]
MNRNAGKEIIFFYNLYILFFYPVSIFMIHGWSLERTNFSGRGSGMPIVVLLIFLPEILLSMGCHLNTTLGGRIFTILSSMVTGWILNKLFHHYFMIKTFAPITYYAENIMLVSGIIWTIVIEFNQNLRNHLLLYPKEQRLVPNAEDETENRYWHGIAQCPISHFPPLTRQTFARPQIWNTLQLNLKILWQIR